MSFTTALNPAQLRQRTNFSNEFGHKRQNHAAPKQIKPISAEDAALFALTAEVSFVARHESRLAKMPGLREAAEIYFDAYFTQAAEGVTPRMVFEEDEIVNVAQGARAGDYFIKEMNDIASDLLRLHSQSADGDKAGRHHLSR